MCDWEKDAKHHYRLVDCGQKHYVSSVHLRYFKPIDLAWYHYSTGSQTRGQETIKVQEINLNGHEETDETTNIETAEKNYEHAADIC